MMQDSNIVVVTARRNFELVRGTVSRIGAHWPEFMLHDPTSQLLEDCYLHLPDFQFVLLPETGGAPMAIGNSIPLAWEHDVNHLPEDGWDWALRTGIDDFRAGRTPRILCALQIVVFQEYRAKGLSSRAVAAMKQLGAAAGLRGMVAPVRPSLKAAYPLVNIDDYVGWTDHDGLPFDPWMRVHHRLGARIIKPCHTAMRIPGTVINWESWTGMRFPQSGRYVVPGALVPVEIDRGANSGLYVEPNIWMYHPPDKR